MFDPKKKSKIIAAVASACFAVLMTFSVAHHIKSPAAFASDVNLAVQKSIAGDQRGLNNMIDEVWAQAARDNFDND
ncbi:hypothetical protein [Fructobacillus evanidus]|uniref:Uncharacterized protein n=1 Tax=Fructobacillus evanidus TaxID=3064281 RepID=A0ABM9MS35_9LACO|nr:unnamed protein product [Fructobacillus sp. LMG 32999]CAK1234621.1 unnamed protein product [Fructobacillus sp. LMG 32999]CAK1235977.1 unnamed protein product [Fructobacillus sp. LMG 32999]CAK1236400.1 unnamed protein product [Fructobacillus sp. LMG 32999]CAK1237337.1 unnamed protein product [Fructobacillus sp. LMG 32999]